MSFCFLRGLRTLPVDSLARLHQVESLLRRTGLWRQFLQEASCRRQRLPGAFLNFCRCPNRLAKHGKMVRDITNGETPHSPSIGFSSQTSYFHHLKLSRHTSISVAIVAVYRRNHGQKKSSSSHEHEQVFVRRFLRVETWRQLP
jgi:hypothetical protein